MLPGEYDFTLYRGDDRRQPLIFRDSDDGTPIDFTDHTWACQVRENHDDAEVVAEFVIEEDDPAAGQIAIYAPGEETEGLPIRDYVYDLESIDTDGFRQTWLYGEITIMPDVTRLGEQEPVPEE